MKSAASSAGAPGNISCSHGGAELDQTSQGLGLASISKRSIITEGMASAMTLGAYCMPYITRG